MNNSYDNLFLVWLNLDSEIGNCACCHPFEVRGVESACAVTRRVKFSGGLHEFERDGGKHNSLRVFI